ncbi:MAG: right-handed parallel beta-helix repeat-containing protein, partial [Bacillota bacterium]
VLTDLVRFAGNPDQGRFVQHVTLKGLAFQHSDWILDPKGNSSTQAAVEVPAAVTADGALHCNFEDCEVSRIGTYGVWFRRGCKDCRIQRNRLVDLGAGGIRVGEATMPPTDVTETSRTLVDNNHIFDGGRVFAAGIGIWLAQSSFNRISHNDIHDLYYSGMSIGWNWGLDKNRTHDNIIEFNHVHDLGHGVLSDAGLIYCLGVSPGCIIRNNVFHDMWPYSEPAFGWGIYLDAQCGNYLVEDNLVYNTLSGGLMYNNGGHEHVIRNNIFALSANHALWPYSEKRPNTFKHNILYLTQGQLFIPYGEKSLNDRLAVKESLGEWDRNLYWHTGGSDQLRFYRRSFADWQKLGLDQHSQIADPQFVNAAAHDFRLKPTSPALQIGFQPLDITRVGLYGDPAWANQVRHADCPHTPLPPPPAPPKPLSINDGFESTPAGNPPAKAQVSGEEHGASIRVSNTRAAAGRRSLKITDSPTLQPTWQPHFYYEPHFTAGPVRQSFDVWFDAKSQFFTEWRDTATYPLNVGPSVRFDGSGTVSVAGKTLATVPAETWIHVEIEAALGKAAPRTFTLTLTPAGTSPQTFKNLPIPGADFHELNWLGFSSTAAADTAFYLDNLTISQP